MQLRKPHVPKKTDGAASPSALGVLLADAHTAGGGQVRYILSLASGLQARGHKVHVACRPGSLLAREAGALGVFVHPLFQFRTGLHPVAMARDYRRAVALLRRAAIHVVHVSGSQDHWLFALANFGGRAALVRSRHNTKRVRNSWANRWLNRRGTGPQICVCAYTQRLLTGEHEAIPAERLHIVHNGVDPALYQPDAGLRTGIRQELGYGDDDIVFGTAARLSRDKGHGYILEALALLKERVPQARALFLGDGPLRKPLEKQAAALGVGAAVRFAGFQRDMPRWVHAFDVGVQPSIDVDTSSFSVKEQMACGIPVVVSDYGGLPEIVEDGAEGRVCPAGNAEALAQAMEQLAGRADLRRQMGGKGRERVLREFALDTFVERTIAIYHTALEGMDKPA